MSEIAIMAGAFPPSFLKEILPPGTPITAGDTKLIWDSSKPIEVEAARETFDKLLKKGYSAFKAEGKDGHQGSQIHAFDATAERMILVPRMQGGA